MKKLSEINVNASKLKLIIGENINYPFPTEQYSPKVGVVKTRTLQTDLATIIKGSSYARKRSHDERFDNKHPVELAIENIKANGLSKTIIAAIRNDFKCQKQIKIVGRWAILNDVITDEHKAFIADLLTKTREVMILRRGEKYYQ